MENVNRYLCAIMIMVLVISLFTGCQNDIERDGISETSGSAGWQANSMSEKDYVVEWTDPIIEQLVRKYLGRSEENVYQSDLDAITRFGVEKREANALTGISEAYILFVNNTEVTAKVDTIRVEDVRYFRNLTELKIDHVPLNDLSFLSDLVGLNKLHILSCEVVDIAALSNLTNLDVLNLDRNNIEDLSPLSDLSSLTFVRLYTNAFHDISAISGMENLKSLYLGDNDIDDYSPLYKLINLEYLVLGNGVSDEQRAELQNELPFCTING